MVNRENPEEIMNLQPISNKIVINANELGPSLVLKLIMQCNNADYWHKFVVENAKAYRRDVILRTIIDFVQPADIMPVNFVKNREQTFFFARNCLDALLKLTSSELVVTNPQNPNIQLKLFIIANHRPAQGLKFDFEEDIKKVLRKRYNSELLLLNLSHFDRDKDLKNFFPLSHPKIMSYILQYAVELRPQCINLSGNFIKVLNPIQVLAGCKITSMNLKDNEIACVDDLEPLKIFTYLKKLKLSGNPLCKGWDSDGYASHVWVMLPSLKSLDQVSVNNRYTAKFRQPAIINFLCSSAGGHLVSKFLEHFFMAYDSENRQRIAPLYHENAMFSITYTSTDKYQKCYRNVKLNYYEKIDRNLKIFNDPVHKYLFRGWEAIMNIFASLPRSFHDPHGFRCDLIYYTDIQANLVVHGACRENQHFVGFTRHFVLKREGSTYKITNDLLHVYNALYGQVKNFDCFPIRVEMSGNPLPYYSSQFMELQVAMHKITNLNYDYCQRYLDACLYDLKKALEIFVEMYEKDEVPPEAFIQIGRQGLPPLGYKKIPYPANIINKTSSKHPSVMPRTVWQTLRKERLTEEYINVGAEQIKERILTSVPSNSTQVQNSTDKPINAGQTTKQQKRRRKKAKKAPQVGYNTRSKTGKTSHDPSNQQTKEFVPSFQPNDIPCPQSVADIAHSKHPVVVPGTVWHVPKDDSIVAEYRIVNNDVNKGDT